MKSLENSLVKRTIDQYHFSDSHPRFSKDSPTERPVHEDLQDRIKLMRSMVEDTPNYEKPKKLSASTQLKSYNANLRSGLKS